MKLAKLAVAVATAAVAVAVTPAAAQTTDWPSKQVTILVPFGAGGNTDIMARLGAEHMNKKFGPPFVVVNRPSAGGVLTSQQLATSDPDGYTLYFAPSSIALLTPMVQNVPFEPDRLVPVTNIGTGSQVVAVKSSLPVKTLPEFLAYAKANPGKLNYASAGVNNISHLGSFLMFKRSDVQLGHVVVRSEPAAVTELLAGNIDFYFGNTSVLLNSDREKLRLLAVGTASRVASAPEIPTISESMPGVVFASWNGFFVPKGTPDAVTSKLRAAIVELVSAPAMQERLNKLGIVPGGQTPQQVEATFKKDIEMFTEAVKAAGIKKPEAK